MDGWQAFKYAIEALGSVIALLLAVFGWFATKLSGRVDVCVTHEDLKKLLAQQAQAEALRAQIQKQMHAQNAKSHEQFVETTRDAFERIERKIDSADESRQRLATLVQDINVKVARLTPFDSNPPPRFNHNR